MLERTAAGLEPCRLQRLLPRTAHARRSRSRSQSRSHSQSQRQTQSQSQNSHPSALHELLQTVDARLGNKEQQQLQKQPSPPPLEMFTPNPPRTEPLVAATFLLDFLYPKGTLAYMRKLAGVSVGGGTRLDTRRESYSGFSRRREGGERRGERYRGRDREDDDYDDDYDNDVDLDTSVLEARERWQRSRQPKATVDPMAELQRLLDEQEQGQNTVRPTEAQLDHAWDMYAQIDVVEATENDAQLRPLRDRLVRFFGLGLAKRRTEAVRIIAICEDGLSEGAEKDRSMVLLRLKACLQVDRMEEACVLFEEELRRSREPELRPKGEERERPKGGEKEEERPKGGEKEKRPKGGEKERPKGGEKEKRPKGGEKEKERPKGGQKEKPDRSALGFGALAVYALRNQQWSMLTKMWSIYRTVSGQDTVDDADMAELYDFASNKVAEHMEALAEGLEAVEYDETTSTPEAKEALRAMQRHLLRTFLHRLEPSMSLSFVRQLQSARIYEQWLLVAVQYEQRTGRTEEEEVVENGNGNENQNQNENEDNQVDEMPLSPANRRSLIATVYSEYRQLPAFRPQATTMQTMVRSVFYPQGDVRGMEEVLKDWYSIRGRPSFWAYQKYLAFYAQRGDVTTTYRLWNEFTALYPTAMAGSEDTFAHLLKVHAVRGDVTRVEQVFASIADQYHVEPNIVCWNIRLHQHVARGRYDEALPVFEALCDAVQPDDYTFGTIMALAGSRGDLPLVLDLLQLARRQADREQKPLVITEAMLDPIVDAYCQNDRFHEAERLCAASTAKYGTEAAIEKKKCTPLWNTLLRHHAFRHDIGTVNRVLQTMTRLHVPYDTHTYSALLFTLAQCRQPRRAAELLRAAHDDRLFQPTAHHYTLLMMAYLRSKQPHRALEVNRLMHHMGFQRSSLQIQMVIKAFGQWQEFPPDDASGARVDRRDLLAKALREFQRSLRPVNETKNPDRDAVRLPLGAVRRFSFVIFLLVQARDFAGVEEVVQLYRAIAPVEERDQPLPLRLCNALMLSDYSEGRFDRVKETWRYVFARTREVGRPGTLGKLGEQIEHEENDEEPPPVVASLRYGLVDPLKTMQRLYAAERDPDGLIALIDQVRAAGFALDSKNWNHYVQHLALLGRTALAFSVCEERLMPGYSPPGTTPRSQTLLESATRFLRPMTYTLMVLAKAYVEVEQAAPWSADAERQLAALQQTYPKTVHAAREVVQMDSRIEGRVFGGDEGGIQETIGRKRPDQLWDLVDLGPATHSSDMTYKPIKTTTSPPKTTTNTTPFGDSVPGVYDKGKKKVQNDRT